MEAITSAVRGSLPRPRLLALDIDGTLLDGRGRLRPRVRDAVRTVGGTGVHVVLATGRSPWGGVAQLAAELGLPGLHVTMQGALVSDPATGRIARRSALPPGIYREALRFAAELGIDPVVALLDGHRAERLPDGVDFLGAARLETRSFRHELDLDRLADAGPMRVFLPTPPERHRAVRLAALERFAGRASIVWSDASGIEVLARGTNKGEAIAWLAAGLRIPPAEVAAVGDGANDLELLRIAGQAAAMRVAPADVRAAADLVVGSSDEDGLVDALRALFPDLEAMADRPPAAARTGGRLLAFATPPGGTRDPGRPAS